MIWEMNWLALTVITRYYYQITNQITVEWSYFSTPYNNVAYQFQVIIHNFLDRI